MDWLLKTLLELFLRLVGGFVWGVTLYAISRFPWLSGSFNTLVTGVMFLGVGLFLGGFSILFFPHAFVGNSSLPGISLIITPVLSGLTMVGIVWIRLRQKKLLVQLESFSYGFVFAFGITLIRFVFTK